MKYNSVLETIGNTPLIRLQRIGRKLPCNLYAKCEFFNPGGSVKDRIGIRMIEKAEAEGRIKPGDTLIEPTSGNTGIGIALAGAVKGYNVIITMPEKMSREKQVILESLGAKIIRTPTEAAWDSPESHISVAQKLCDELPNAHILDQYSNKENPLAHYEHTASEILRDLDGKVDMVVIGAGTGGTISGCAKKLKEANPHCIIVGADPVGSILAGGTYINSYKVEGIGYDFIPQVLDLSCIDRWVKTDDRSSFLWARRLISEEGLLCGGSSGATLFAAMQEAAKLPAGANCVVLLADGVRNYLSKFVDDKWMRENRFNSMQAIEGIIGDFSGFKHKKQLITLNINEDIGAAISLMREKGYSQIPVVGEDGKLLGILYDKSLLESVVSGQVELGTTKVFEMMSRNVSTVSKDTPVASLQELLLTDDCVVVVDALRKPLQIVTKIDLVEWLSK
jgi:cystathionine beta-synthase